MRARLMTVSLMLVLQAAALPAQEAAVTPFTRGQWAADVIIGSGFSGLGVVRFISPTRAWALDVRVDAGSRADTNQAGTINAHSWGLSGRLSRRGYRAMGSRVYRTVAIGISGRYNYDKSSQSSSVEQTATSLGAGVFAELGAQWMVTSHLSLGALWGIGANYNYFHSTATGNYDSRSKRFDVTLGNVGLRGALYF